ncbi:patatin family protein [Alicyclobacillus tolerans]|uniref:patatin-like phospholipase family protein n=1 Tax=Alicyclobacillus tolerans TaxID=90970 RepID=UPI001F42AA34|nr:patatin family protein [Alicyclobacillus tolerans]MCF8564279.1 patatin family protein [Alicyclobacillus tolerans]
MDRVGLVLEGGGLRGVYTAGVLEFFADHNLYFPYTIGVSAGACNAVSYLSKQKGRNKVVNIDFIKDFRYLSWRNMWRSRELFGTDFIFDEIPHALVPFDYDTFHAGNEEFVIGTTDCETGEPVYYAKSEGGFDLMHILRASSSLPFIAPIVEHAGRKLMDGGIADPIPIRKAEQDGWRKNVVVLTQSRDYVKKPNRFSWVLQRNYGQYPHFVETILTRHRLYNATTDYVKQQVRKGLAFVIQPKTRLAVGRVERNQEKLKLSYQQGYDDARQAYPALSKWLGQA